MIEIEQLRELPISERIQLVEDLWDTVAADSSHVRLSATQLKELDRRIDRSEKNPNEGILWSSLKARIQNSL